MILGDYGAAFFRVAKTSESYAVRGRSSAFLGYGLGKGLPEPGDGGTWARWHWDGRRFEFTNDDLGFMPLFYHSTSESFGISTNIADLVGPPSTLEFDDDAIAVFLRISFYLADSTPFKNIRAIPPGCRLSWEDGRLQIEGGTIDPPEIISISRESAKKEYGAVFRSVIEELKPNDSGRLCLPLSGGRDSRHILLELDRCRFRPDVCATIPSFPPKSLQDVIVASELAKQVQVDHVVLDQTQDIFSAEKKKNLYTNFHCCPKQVRVLFLTLDS